jgi:NADPH:quinone reductase-like Zn-dependent oxidoreductase
MRAIAIEDFGGPERLQLMSLPRPKAGKKEVLIRAVAVGVNPVDWAIREGRLKEILPHAFPLVPGWDVAGVIEEMGEHATRFRKGDRVWSYAWKPRVQWGCYAEYVAVDEASVALMPTKLLYEEAASVPLAALTAWQCLFHHAGVGPGASVLVHAASGGVGHFAVQLARHAGADVIGTAGTSNQPFVLELGAVATVDYTKEDFREVVRRHRPEGVDLAICSTDAETMKRSYDVIKPGGRLVSLIGAPDHDEAARHKVTACDLFVEPDAEQLATLAGLIDLGKLRPHVQKIYGLRDAAEAQKRSAEGHVRGKLVLNL